MTLKNAKVKGSKRYEAQKTACERLKGLGRQNHPREAAICPYKRNAW